MELDVSVIVPTFNRSDKLKNLLKSLSGIMEAVPKEVIIVDDRSTDNTEEVVREWCSLPHPFKAIYVKMDKNGGPAKARNKGTMLASGDAVAFTDSDCVIHPGWIKNLSEKLASDKEFAGVGGKVLPLNDHKYSRYYALFKSLDPPPTLKYLVGANCIFDRKKFLEANGFDDYIGRPGGEEVGLCYKLYNLGCKCGFAEDAIIYHDYRASLKDFSRTYYNYGYGGRLVWERYVFNPLNWASIPYLDWSTDLLGPLQSEDLKVRITGVSRDMRRLIRNLRSLRLPPKTILWYTFLNLTQTLYFNKGWQDCKLKNKKSILNNTRDPGGVSH